MTQVDTCPLGPIKDYNQTVIKIAKSVEQVIQSKYPQLKARYDVETARHNLENAEVEYKKATNALGR